MDNFIVSARKYRPITFDTVVGQESVTRTLKNAITNNHLSHSYLFCGPRGVGKTTCARILAKTINCVNINEKAEPCDQCDSCVAFNESRSYNIHELDAASNNSVDDVRNLIEQVRIPPQVGTYSVYIIDEVHMLSSQAFNAFLKTLEEPPEHAVFILATTEKHKIIPTILSRCQIFDFNRIHITDIVDHLAEISESEDIKYEKDAFNIIAQKADGSLRDALSIYDQIVSFTGKTIGYKDVIENLNVLDFEYYFRLTELFLQNNYSEALLVYNEILNNGFDSRIFLTGLSSHFRDLLVSKEKITIELLDVGDSIKQRYAEQSSKCSTDFLIKSLSVLNQCDVSFVGSQNKRLHIELALIRLCNITPEKKKPESGIEDKNIENSEDEKPDDQEVKRTEEEVKEKNVADNSSEKEEKNTQNKSFAGNQAASTFSIKSAYNNIKNKSNNSQPEPEKQEKEEIKEEPEIEKNDEVIELTGEKVVEKWNEYAEKIKETEERLYHTLISRKPELKENNTISFSVDNPLQLEAVNSKENEILKFLSGQFNESLSLEVNIVKETKKHIPYTNKEKYMHMVNKNPELDKLRQEFNLDFD